MRQIVLDTNVLVAGLRSRLGASFQLLQKVGSAKAGFEANFSVPLVFEYEMALRRDPVIDDEVADAVLAYLCRVGNAREIFFLWRPFLRDPSDEMVLEVAVGAEADVIVTHNTRDYTGVEDSFGIGIMTPRDFLMSLEEE